VHYGRIRDAAPDCELYAYIFPERTGVPVPPAVFGQLASAVGLAGAKVSGKSAADLAQYVAAAPGLRIFSGDDSDPERSMRVGGAGVVSGRSSAYAEIYAALSSADAGTAREALRRVVALGASIGRVKYALRLRGFGTGTARMSVDAPGAETAAAIAAEVAALPEIRTNVTP
jgi:4-hydroxy-tetrahydrodipicolinate synthase